MLSQRVTAPLLQMARLVNQYDDARLRLGVVAKLVNQPAEEGVRRSGVRTPLVGQIEFADVSFSYKGATTPGARRRLVRKSPTGSMFGIMGRSGSGKTTVTRLLQRLHSDYEGLIKIDGIDCANTTSTICARSVGVVLQENFLFSGTIRENIARGANRCDLRRGRPGGAARRRRGVHRPAAARLRDLHLRGVAQSLGRPAPAAGDRPGADHRPAHPDPRRGDQRARRRERGDRQRQHLPRIAAAAR